MGSIDESESVMGELERAGAVYTDRHFVYKSGMHGSGYINMDPIYTDPAIMLSIGRGLLLPFDEAAFTTIAAPAVGGVALVTYVGVEALKRYGKGGSIVWADKDGTAFRFERAGFVGRISGKRVLVVEDLLTTGGSVATVCREVEKHDGFVVGVSAIVNRGGVTAEQLGVPHLAALAEVNFEAVDVQDCELCAKHVPIVRDIGHGLAFEIDNPLYKGGFETLLS
jgi:orotate phosphoribosyltransferase